MGTSESTCIFNVPSWLASRLSWVWLLSARCSSLLLSPREDGRYTTRVALSGKETCDSYDDDMCKGDKAEEKCDKRKATAAFMFLALFASLGAIACVHLDKAPMHKALSGATVFCLLIAFAVYASIDLGDDVSLGFSFALTIVAFIGYIAVAALAGSE